MTVIDLAMRDVHPVLEATTTLVAATGILNVWANDPVEQLPTSRPSARTSPDGSCSASASATARRRPSPASRSKRCAHSSTASTPPRRPLHVTSAVSRRSGRRCSNLHVIARRARTPTSSRSSKRTHATREQLGPGKLIATELACGVDTDPVHAKAITRNYATLYLGLRNYVRNLLRYGFTEDDVANGGSDRLIDAIIPQGSAEEIAAIVHAHLDARVISIL